MKKKVAKGLLLAVVSVMVAPAAFASVPWVGTANYLVAPGNDGDEAFVGPFDTYDFGAGIGLIQSIGSAQVGGQFNGWFQTMVNSHILNGTGLTVPQLNTSGTGSGFELTVISQFTGTYTSLAGGVLGFSIDNGSASLMFDSSPDYNFGADSGFSNGNAILAGSITGGSGSVNMNIGYGFEAVTLDMTGALAVVNSSVYNPSNINGASTLFSVAVKTPNTNTPVINQVASGSNSVLGNTASGGQLFELDGNMQLTAVPVPGAAWLFLSALMGFVSVSRKKRIV